MTANLYGTPTQGSDGNILMEFVLMERLWADSSGQDSYDPYTCAVNSALFIECLDIGGARTLASSLSDSVAYNMSGSEGDLNKNFYAVLALEGLLNMSGNNVSGHFGGTECSGKVVGDGAVNAYDMAILMWYQFKFEPYDVLPNDPSTVATVQGRDDTAYRCNLGETRRMWQSAIGEDYCHNGQNAMTLGYASERRLSQTSPLPVLGDTEESIFQPYAMSQDRVSTRRLDTSQDEASPFSARETRSPVARRDAVNREDMLRGVNAMRTLDVDVAEWGFVKGYGRWIRIRAPGVQVAMELYMSGLSVDEPVHLSMQSVPSKNCTECIPSDDDFQNVVVAFARRAEYEDSYNTAVASQSSKVCASIVPAVVQSNAMYGNTIGLRQQPPSRACGFDIFLWIPAFPKKGVYVSQNTVPFSYAARRLQAVGAESAAFGKSSGCDGDIGVLPGSSAMDAFLGQIQRSTSCTRYGFTKPELIRPIVDTGSSCTAAHQVCSLNAPSASLVASRSFGIFASSGLENAYVDSIRQVTDTLLESRTAGVVLASSIDDASSDAAAHARQHVLRLDSAAYVHFESSLARNSHGACCEGSVCVLDAVDGVTPTCHPSSPSHAGLPPIPMPLPPRPPVLSPPYNLPSPASTMGVTFKTTVGEPLGSFDSTAYAVKVANAVGVPVSHVSVKVLTVIDIVETTVVETTVTPVDDTLEAILNSLESVVLANTTVATSVLGVTINAVQLPTVVPNHERSSPPPAMLASSSPPPAMLASPSAPISPSLPLPSSPNEETEDNTVVIVVAPLCGFFLCGICLLCARWFVYRPRTETPPGEKTSKGNNKGTTTSLLGSNQLGIVVTPHNQRIDRRNLKNTTHDLNLAKAFEAATQATGVASARSTGNDKNVKERRAKSVPSARSAVKDTTADNRRVKHAAVTARPPLSMKFPIIPPTP